MTERMIIMKILARIDATIVYGDEKTIEVFVGTPYSISFNFDENGNVTCIDTYE